MSIDRRLLAYIGKRYPAAWDVIPRGPLFDGDAQVSLNPQPIPPGVETVALNPQPLPPRILGALVANEVVRLAWTAEHVGVRLAPIADWDGDICPTYPKPPILKGPFPPVPDPDPGPEWIRDYHLGLATTLAAVEGRLAESTTVVEALELSSESLSRSLDKSIG